jgi:hypothetical protein
MNTGDCEKCCVICQEGQVVREKRLRDEFDGKTKLLRKQNESMLKEIERYLSLQPTKFSTDKIIIKR